MKFDARGAELLRGSVRGFGVRIVSVGLVFLFNVALTRWLGADSAGLFYLGLAIISPLVVIGLLGIDNGSVRHMANLWAERRWTTVSRLSWHLSGVVLLSTSLLAALLYVVAPYVTDVVFGKPELSGVLANVALAIPALAMLALTSRFLQSSKRPALALFFENSATPAVLLAFMLVLPAVRELDGIVAFYPLAALAALLIAFALWRSGIPRGEAEPGEYGARAVLHTGLTLLPANVMNRIVQPWTAVLLLGAWGTLAEVAWFTAATRVASLVSFAILPVNTMLAPTIAVLGKQGEHEALFRLVARAMLIILVIAIPALVPIVVAPGWVMSVFGPDFAAAGVVLLILAGGQAINALTGPVQSILVMTGNESSHRNASMAGGVSCVLACLLLIPGHGAMGAAVATAVAVVVTNTVSAWMVWRLFRAKA